MSLRFSTRAAGSFREAVRDADGVEVFAIGDVEGGVVVNITVAARGQADRVLAVLGRPRAGQVVIHNHPSADLRPSDPDLQLASRYSEDGVGFVIVDSEVTASNWVVEPWVAGSTAIDAAEVDRFFTEGLPSAIEGWEVRDAQREMAALVTRSLNENRPAIVEAGTGTGKSLAYLVPAAMWALANDSKVVVATHTRALQAQLLSSDLPLLARGGIEVRTAVLEGRNNYVCKRRLGLAKLEEDDLEPEQREAFDEILAWSETTEVGSRSELGFRVPAAVWERVESDSDLTLRMRCEHYDTCHFYAARRRAAGAHVVVVNHALLLADLVLRDEAGFGILPKYGRVILDEAHHLEDVATGAGASRVTLRAVQRAVGPLLPRKKKPGALARLGKAVDSDRSLGDRIAGNVSAALADAAVQLEALTPVARDTFGELAGVLDPSEPAKRADDAWESSPEWEHVVQPRVSHLARTIEQATDGIDKVIDAFEDQRLADAKAQPLLDLKRAQGRLERHGIALRTFLALHDTEVVRWLELERSRGRSEPTAAVSSAPIDVGPLLRRLLWDPLPGATATSATLSVAGDFTFWRARHGLFEAEELVLASPFDHFEQAILGLPRDLPSPEHPAYLRETARTIVEAVEISDGGAFVLCTSWKAVEAYAEVLRRTMPDRPLLAQGTASRPALLRRFRAQPRAVLVGTDSFWEGVSVKGDGLRLVIVPRLPFRVPTDPLSRARHERLEAKGVNPFGAYTLPLAVLKLRQGYGRLLRARSDRGVVLLLDTRVHTRRYGHRILAALPPARRVKGPWRQITHAMRAFFGVEEATAPTPAPSWQDPVSPPRGRAAPAAPSLPEDDGPPIPPLPEEPW